MRELELPLRGDFVTLDALLKATGLADSGGRAKQLIAAGKVTVDGAPETRRGRKLRAGQMVTCGDARVRVLPAAVAGDSSGIELPAGTPI